MKSWARKGLRVLAHFLRMMMGMWSGPVDFLLFRERMMDSTVWDVTACIGKQWGVVGSGGGIGNWVWMPGVVLRLWMCWRTVVSVGGSDKCRVVW